LLRLRLRKFGSAKGKFLFVSFVLQSDWQKPDPPFGVALAPCARLFPLALLIKKNLQEADIVETKKLRDKRTKVRVRIIFTVEAIDAPENSFW